MSSDEAQEMRSSRKNHGVSGRPMGGIEQWDRYDEDRYSTQKPQKYTYGRDLLYSTDRFSTSQKLQSKGENIPNGRIGEESEHRANDANFVCPLQIARRQYYLESPSCRKDLR